MRPIRMLMATACILISSMTCFATDDITVINTPVFTPRLLELAEGGNPYAQNNLGIVYQKGFGVELDLEKAAYWFLRGAEGGSGMAMSNIGVAYLKGRGVEQNIPLAVEWFEKSANAGTQNGCFNMATLYYQGLGVEKDGKKALEYALKALNAEPASTYTDNDAWTQRHGMGRIQMFLAMCYEEGVGTAPDKQKAFDFTRLAAHNGNPEGCLMMAQAYEKGENVIKSLPWAEKCYIVAADAGYYNAQYILGSRYYSGEIFKKNYKLAAKYLGMVINNSKLEAPPMIKADAMLKLASLLERSGKKADSDRAAKLRKEASALPTPDAAEIRSWLFY